jgi:hypothetical protein
MTPERRMAAAALALSASIFCCAGDIRPAAAQPQWWGPGGGTPGYAQQRHDRREDDWLARQGWERDRRFGGEQDRMGRRRAETRDDVRRGMDDRAPRPRTAWDGR